MTISRYGVLASLALFAATTGCRSMAERAREKAEEKAIERQTGGQVQLSGDKLMITTDAGTVALGGNASVPDDFPRSVPIYPGSKVGMAARQAQGSKPAWSVMLETPDDAAKVAAYYKANLGSFKQASDVDLGGSHIMAYQSGDYDVSVIIAGTGKDTSITLGVKAK